jgi:hypothetical protein
MFFILTVLIEEEESSRFNYYKCIFQFLSTNDSVYAMFERMLCFVDRAPRYIHLKKNQLDAQFIFSIFRQIPLHVSGVSIAHHQEITVWIQQLVCLLSVYIQQLVLIVLFR